MAITKRGKYWHYEFMIDGRKYRGTTKETVKSRANTVEALLIADVRNNGGHVNLRRAPVLRDFSERFLEYVDAQAISGQLDLDTKRYYHGGWKMLEGNQAGWHANRSYWYERRRCPDISAQPLQR